MWQATTQTARVSKAKAFITSGCKTQIAETQVVQQAKAVGPELK
jgi:hypothetical protein